MNMIQPAVERSPGIKIVSALMLLLTAGFIIAACATQHGIFIFAASLLAVVTLLGYLWTPVRYEVSGDRLTVVFHLGARRFEPVLRCSPIERSLIWSLRLFGNGGVFAGIGYYWNRMLGFFQAYVTSSRRAEPVLIEPDRRKIVISPQHPRGYIATWHQLKHERRMNAD